MSIIGIDLGTTNSLAACWKNGRAELIPNASGSFLTPSVVSVMNETEILAGQAAKERLLVHPKESAAAFKRFMGTDKRFVLGTKSFSPVELSALILKRLKQDAEQVLGEPVDEAIITVPAYFNHRQRADTKLAAQLAGLHTERLINEPSAAALAYQMSAKKKEAALLIFDFGGGTLDISLVECYENVIEIEAVAGDNHLGGNDVDDLLCEYILQRHPEAQTFSAQGLAGLRNAIEQVKCALGQSSQVLFSYSFKDVLVEETLTSQILRKLCLPLLERMRHLFSRVLRDGMCEKEDIDAVVMVGGSSRLSFVQDFVEELFSRSPFVMEGADLVVAMGVGAYAGIRMRSEDIRDIVMTDVCPFTLGTAVVWDKSDRRPHMCPVLERNCPLPFSRTVTLRTVSDGQENIRVGIYQGESYYAVENVCLGAIHAVVRPRPAGEESISVTFSYDINGVLKVEAADSTLEKKEQLFLNGHMSKKETEDRLRELEQLKLPSKEREEYEALQARLLWIFEQYLDRKREKAGLLIYQLTQAWETGKHLQYRKARDCVQQFLKEIQETSEAGSKNVRNFPI